MTTRAALLNGLCDAIYERIASDTTAVMLYLDGFVLAFALMERHPEYALALGRAVLQRDRELGLDRRLDLADELPHLLPIEGNSDD